MRPARLVCLLLAAATACSTNVSSAGTAPARDTAPTTAGSVTGRGDTGAASTAASSTAGGEADTVPERTAAGTATTTQPTPSRPRIVSMAFTGDTLPHSPLWRRARRNAEEAGLAGHDFTPMLSGLSPVLDTVDLAVCHLETPIAPEGEEYTTMPLYGVPAEIADSIVAAGYDRCSTASNHTADRGAAGIDRTVDVLEERGLGQSGMARRPAEIHPSVFEVAGVATSHLSYTWSYNGLSLPNGEEWRSAIIEPARIIRDAKAARTRGAELVIVSMHWGAEGSHQPTRFQREVADEITASGTIDLVVGHHAHVVQPIELVNDTWVLYGLGNILSNLPTSNRWPAASQDAAVVTVTMTIDEAGSVAVEQPVVHPTWVDKDAGWVVRLVDAELERDDISAGQRGRLERSRDRTLAVLGEFVPAGPDATS